MSYRPHEPKEDWLVTEVTGDEVHLRRSPGDEVLHVPADLLPEDVLPGHLFTVVAEVGMRELFLAATNGGKPAA